MHLDTDVREALAEEVRRLVAWFEALKERLDGTVDAIEIVSQRIKSEASISHKLQALPYLTVPRIQDVIGIRVVCVSGLGVQKVNREMVDHFGARILRGPREKLTELGYRSWHTVLKPAPDGPAHHAEVQTRSLTQHAWARVSELLAYKDESTSVSLLEDLLGLSRDLNEQDRRIEDLFHRAAV